MYVFDDGDVTIQTATYEATKFGLDDSDGVHFIDDIKKNLKISVSKNDEDHLVRSCACAWW